jgi:signal transduction histidine kinase
MENLLKSTSLIKRAYWLIRLRWVAIGALGIATFVATRFMQVTLPAATLYVIGGILLVYNFVLYGLLRYWTWGAKVPSDRCIGQIITIQISADLLVLAGILHYSGGIENPFSFFFVFHMIIASILRPRLQSYVQATLAIVLFGGLVALEATGILKHYPLKGFAGHGLYDDAAFVFGFLFVFTTTLYLVVYMTTSISEQLRNQQESYAEANALLEKKDRLKNKYVLRVTHDIKGHLAAVQSCLDIVFNEMVGPLNDRQKDLVERAHRRTGRCMAFITALLKLTRMRLTGQLEMGRLSLKNCVFSALTCIQNRAQKKNIVVTHEIDASVDEVPGEAVLIEETITNMLFNAVKYTPDGGKVRLEVLPDGAFAQIRITDTGIGVPAKDSTRIFDEFYRADNARQRERDGTGLGLAFAKEVVERHGGRIWVEDNPNGGSVFTFTLPLGDIGALD